MKKIILLIGAPGAGKGTQARLLQERRSLPQISTGDIFRALSKANTPLAHQLKAILESGQLVSDDLVIQLVEDRTTHNDCRNGYILDGFPRTIAQAEKLEELSRTQDKVLQAVLIDVPFDLLEKRLTGRSTCPICGEIYNDYFKPPKVTGFCDVDPGTQLAKRDDDKVERVRARLQVYKSETAPLIEYYEKSSRLNKIDGTRETEAVYENLKKVVAG